MQLCIYYKYIYYIPIFVDASPGTQWPSSAIAASTMIKSRKTGQLFLCSVVVVIYRASFIGVGSCRKKFRFENRIYLKIETQK